MWTAALLSFLIAAGGIAGTVYLYLEMPSWIYLPLLRFLIMLGPLLASSLVFVLIATISDMAQSDRNASCMAPIVGMSKGFPLYPDPANGVLSQWLDGPLAALLLWPATLCTHSTSAIAAGGTLLLIMWLAPVSCLQIMAMCERDGPEDLAETFLPHFAALCFVSFVWLLLDQPSTYLKLSSINADAPATALLACTVLPMLLRRRNRWINVAVSVTCAALALWTKLSIWPAILGVPIYLLIADGRRAAGIYIGALAVSCSLISYLVLILFGRANLWFYVATLPRSLPWQNAALSGWQHLFVGSQLVLANTIWPVAGIGTLVLLEAGLVAPAIKPLVGGLTRRRRVQLWLDQNPWVMLPILAGLLLPNECVGAMTFNGDIGSFAPANYLVLAAASFLCIRLFRVASLQAIGPSRSSRARLPCYLLLSMAILAGLSSWGNATLGAHNAERLFLQIATAGQNAQAEVQDDSAAYPETTYFPWNTLSSLLAEGKYYNPELGVLYRYAAHLDPKAQQLLSHLPAHMHYLAYGPESPSRAVVNLLATPQTTIVQDPLLPKFVLYKLKATEGD